MLPHCSSQHDDIIPCFFVRQQKMNGNVQLLLTHTGVDAELCTYNHDFITTQHCQIKSSKAQVNGRRCDVRSAVLMLE